MHWFSDALLYLNLSLSIRQNATLQKDHDIDIGFIFFEIGLCHYRSQNSDEALTVLNQALPILENSMTSGHDVTISDTRYLISSCHRGINISSQKLKIKRNTHSRLVHQIGKKSVQRTKWY